jgi:DNA-binding transcriptional LysR family regulator
VSLPVNSAVQVMLQREAARLGRTFDYRVVVANFEAALRVVHAGLAVCLVPREVAAIYARAYQVKVIALAEPWAKRRFIVVHRGEDTLTPAAKLLVDYLAAQAADSLDTE